MADPARVSTLQIAIVPEVTRGTTPSNPAFQVLPIIEGSLISLVRAFERSAIIRSNRMGGKQIGGTRHGEGTLIVPIANETNILTLLESLLNAAFSTVTLSAVSGTFAASGKTFTRGSGNFLTEPVTARLQAGDKVTISGTSSNNGVKTILSISSTVITFVSTDTIVNEGPVSTTFTSNRKRADAGSTRKFFTVEVKYTYGDGSVSYDRLLGAEAGRATFNLPTSGGSSMNIEMVGIDVTLEDSSAISGATYTAASGATQMAASVTGVQLAKGGSALAGVESMSLTIDNNVEIKNAVGSATADHVAQGDFNANGSFAAYYRTGMGLGTAFKNGTRDSLAATVVAEDTGDKAVFSLPRVVLTQDNKGNSGPTITQAINFDSEEDTSYSTKMYAEFVTA
jgi:hypothetical protein